MRFRPMGRPIRPSPINPIFLRPRADSKSGLLENRGRKTRRYFLQKEDTIVAETMAGRCGGTSFTNQAVLGRLDRGRMPGAPPAAARAAALRGSGASWEATGASGVASGTADSETPLAEAPGSGFSSMRTKY